MNKSHLINERLRREIKSFKDLWRGGYFEGDPLQPMGESGYKELGFMSVLHATYLRCIKPYINNETVVLEIGPGRGAWTKTMLGAKEIVVLDALSAEHNRFFEYVGCHNHITYFQIKDFECKVLKDDYFNYMFSFGCLCHVSFDGIKEYAKNIFPKLKSGSNCFWMIADYKKYNKAISNLDKYSIFSLIPSDRKYFPLKLFLKFLMRKEKRLQPITRDKDDQPRPGRWYHAGIERTCSMLKRFGYHIIDPDVGTCHRDPIIHFIKP